MKLRAPYQKLQCAAIVQPGEYLIDRWDGKQCEETNPHWLGRCEYCGLMFCLSLHFYKHLNEEVERDEAP